MATVTKAPSTVKHAPDVNQPEVVLLNAVEHPVATSATPRRLITMSERSSGNNRPFGENLEEAKLDERLKQMGREFDRFVWKTGEDKQTAEIRVARLCEKSTNVEIRTFTRLPKMTEKFGSFLKEHLDVKIRQDDAKRVTWKEQQKNQTSLLASIPSKSGTQVVLDSPDKIAGQSLSLKEGDGETSLSSSRISSPVEIEAAADDFEEETE